MIKVKEVAYLLRIIRELKGLSQETVAKQIGCSRQSMSLWEEGKVKPSRDKLEKWMQVVVEAKEELWR